jgi:acyl-CoA synthetase (AMP-forming)/AMP-acid ligase II
MASTLPKLPLFEAISKHDPQSTSIIHSASGRRFTYGQLLHDVAERTDQLVEEAGGKELGGERIAFLVENSYDYVGAQYHDPFAFIEFAIKRIHSNSTFHLRYAFYSTAAVAGFPCS